MTGRKHPARHFTGNLCWTRNGQVLAGWTLRPLPRARTEDLAQAVHQAHRSLYRSLVGRTALLRGLLTWTDPVDVVARMTAGVDLATHPSWARECEAAIDLLDNIPLGQRRFFLTVPLTTSFRHTLNTAVRSAVNEICDAAGLNPEPPGPAEIAAYTREAYRIQQQLPPVFAPTPMTVAEQVWTLRHAQTRSLEGEVDPIQAPALAAELLDDVTSRAVIGEPWLDPMAISDLDPADHAARLAAPFNRRILKVATDAGATNYQAPILLADVPPAGMIFPATEFLGRVDDAGIPVDLAIHLTVRSRHEALRRNKKAMRQLNDQLVQIDGAGPDQGSHEVRLYDAAGLLSTYNTEMQRDPKEVEVEPIVILSTVGATREEADQNAADFIGADRNRDFSFARPVGAEEATFWAMQPGGVVDRQIRDYRLITKSAAFATSAAITTCEAGSETGWLFGINKTSALWSPVFMDLFGDARRDISPSVVIAGELGSGKSFAEKAISGHAVCRGAKLIAVDPSSTREWVTFAQSLPSDTDQTLVVTGCDIADPTTSLDPLRLLPAHRAAPVVQSFLITLLDIGATSVEGRTLAKTLKPRYLADHHLGSLAALHRHLSSDCELPEAAAIADRIDVFADPDLGGSLAAALFNDDLPALNLGADAIVLGTANVVLPTDAELTNAHLYKSLPVEKIFGRAIYAMIANLAEQLCFADPAQPWLFNADEFHSYSQSSEAIAAFIRFIRYGRKSQAAVVVGSHDAEADFADETLRGLIKNKLVLRLTDEKLAAKAATFLGADPIKDRQLHAELTAQDPAALTRPRRQRRPRRPPRRRHLPRPPRPPRRHHRPPASPRGTLRSRQHHTTRPGHAMTWCTPRRLCLAALAAAITVATLTGVAYSDDGTATVLGPFNIADSHGIKISQYELSIDTGGITDFGTTLQSQALTGVWDTYRMLIGFIAYAADWVVGMTWITWITGPINSAAQSIHDSLLTPLHMDQLGTTGLMGLLAATAGAIITIHFIRGRTGRALSEILISATIAAAVVGILAAPVVTFAGTDTEPAAPLRVAQRIGLEISNLILDKPLSDASIESTLQPGQAPIAETVQPVHTGGLLVDTFIRPVHQLVNYGTVLDTTNQKCAQAYDQALKGGPYDDTDKARHLVGRCDKKLEDYAESSSWLRIVGLNLYLITAGLLALLVLIFAVLLVFAVITLTWASLKLIIHAPLAIIPGDTRGPSIRDLVDIAISLVYVVAGIAALSVVIKLTNATLTDTRTVPLQVRFVGIDLILLAGLALLIANYVAHRRGARTVGERIMSRLRQSPRTATPVGQKAMHWLTQPSFAATNLGAATTAMQHGSHHGRRPLNRITASNGVRLAVAAGSVAAGGAGLGLKTLSGTSKIAYRTGRVGFHAARAGTRAAVHTAHETSKAWQVHQTLRRGGQHATTGHNHLDQVLTHTARAHQHLADQASRAVTAAAATGVLSVGPRPTQAHRTPPTEAIHPAVPQTRTAANTIPNLLDPPRQRQQPTAQPRATFTLNRETPTRPAQRRPGTSRHRAQAARNLIRTVPSTPVPQIRRPSDAIPPRPDRPAS